MLNKTMCLLSLSLLFTASTVNTKPTFVAEQSIEKINLKEMVQTDLKNELPMNKLRVHNGEKTSIQLYTEEQEKIRLETEKQKKLKEERLKGQEQEENEHKRNFIVSYYGATYNECGNNHFITASGIPVAEGQIAVPRNIPFGSKIILEGIEYIATDTGNPKYICELSDGTLRVDVFIARDVCENDYKYEKRINSMGIKKVSGELYIKEEL
ncbi:3D domain-containing protein [Clostridium sp. VAP52]|uniref:3D domain-containing protein n=1 Tax=Clostridium sp. VAP52 TaxID=2949977 RepID=UPI00207992EB|nr:3D domain-containing protein [Clostridium sp. VAP52]